jgi:hypothetical protein
MLNNPNPQLKGTTKLIIEHARPKVKYTGTQFVPIVLSRPGQPDEIFYAPRCYACGQLIFDLEDANVSTVLGDIPADAKDIPIGKIATNTTACLIPCLGAFVFHKACDSANTPWTEGSCVFRADQRYEKPQSRRRGRGR